MSKLTPFWFVFTIFLSTYSNFILLKSTIFRKFSYQNHTILNNNMCEENVRMHEYESLRYVC